MAYVTVGRWGKNLAVRLPLDITRATGLHDGERVEIETKNGEIVIRRPDVGLVADAQAAATEIIEESKRYSLGDTTVRELLDEGRRG